jgi:ubiquinone/menaquinone biosynthesis C-methylase UbiE
VVDVSLDQWWQVWAPFWEPFEDRHFEIAAVERILPFVASPVLVVGAGQGILVEHLGRHGHDVVGLDASEAMVVEARRRRGLECVLGDARKLPFDEARFGTVLIATGVLDYQAEPDAAHAMLCEGLRVLRPWGIILTGFYRFPPKLERVYREIGVIEADRYHSRRLFELGEIARKGPFRCVPLIARWTGRGPLATAVYWANTIVWMRKVFQHDARALEKVLQRAERAGCSPAKLLAHVPDILPYRNEEQIRALLEGAGVRAVDLSVLDDCIVVRHQKHGDPNGGEPESKSRDPDPDPSGAPTDAEAPAQERRAR